MSPAWVHGRLVSRIWLAKILKRRQLYPRKGCHPVDGGLSELIRRADIDADVIIGFDYETDRIVPVEGDWGLAICVAVKLSCAA
jgi:hypothetical protein